MLLENYVFFLLFPKNVFLYVFIIANNRKKRKTLKTLLEIKTFLNLLRFKKKRMENLASVSLMCKITNPSQPSYSLAHSLLDWQPFSERSFK